MGFIGAMNDRCKLGVPATPTGGKPRPASYTYGDEIRCRYSRVGSKETLDGSEVKVVNAEIRIPAGTTVTNKYRVQLTKINGETLNPVKYFAIIGEPWETLSEIVLNVKLLTGNSAT